MQCRLCGGKQTNYLEDGIYWCKDCDRYFNRRGEVFYTEDGDIKYTRGRDVGKLYKGYRYLNHKKILELFGKESSVSIAQKTELSSNTIYNIRAKRQDSAKIETIDKIATAYLVDPKELIS